jgi:hypothetical protein
MSYKKKNRRFGYFMYRNFTKKSTMDADTTYIDVDRRWRVGVARFVKNKGGC